jgi:hypothetical protein
MAPTSTPTPSKPTTVTLTSDANDHMSARVTRAGATAGAEEELLTLHVKSLTLGRENVDSEISPQRAVASIMTVVALTWAT